MEQSEGFIENLNVVLQLHHAIYSLKQAGLAWWHQLDVSMKELGFEWLKSKARIFRYRKTGTNTVIAVVYVDDIFFCGPRKTLLNKIKGKFMQK